MYKHPLQLKNFNAPSTLVVSARYRDLLVGCLSPLSDKSVRSVICDLAVLREFQNRGIGKRF